ncbi:serine hydrolase [Kitasatospora sp. SUK 42]|uniref:serine hydrolase domain-containing protein n=1 Tax=Kitasatospora sp. SUK 42 TaxID=1588882 RepID=UPI0018C9AC00|nr:serine hydrolase domain-containing protein [Kitasatospora sp. SUK 42]MBV2155467.1 beta-lactamase family protein [Kitasatospora sp. SUK 42]
MAIAKRTALALAGLLLAATPAPALAVGPNPANGPDPAALSAAIAAHPGDPAAGVVARVTVDGRVWRGTAEDPVSGRPVAPNAAFRIGSINKPFVAAVLLQLSAEHRIDLDGAVQQYLPDISLTDAFQQVTVRQLLNHTSGLPQAVEGPDVTDDDGLIAQRFGLETLEEVAQRTLHPEDNSKPKPTPAFTPGTRQQYNSFNYRLAGLVIERVTGHSIKEEVTARILKPLGLRHTEVPEGRPEMPEPHLTGWYLNTAGTPTDVSEQGGNPESMVSTPSDVDRFLRALLDGELLAPQQLHDLLALPRDASGQLVPYYEGGDCLFGPDKGKACYSAGLMAIPLQDGTVVWGKTGHDLGYSDGVFATSDLSKRLVYSVGTGPGTPAPALRLAATVFGPFAR